MIDLIFFVVLIVAIIQGYRKGLIIALFSVIAFIVGLAAAIKLSAIVAVRLHDSVNVSYKWLPLLSFLLVFFVVAFLISLGGKLIEKTFEMVLLGWLNRLGGMVLYALLYTLIFSVFLFYADKLAIFGKAAIDSSKMYPIVAPFGPKVIEGLGKLVPLFKDSFHQLEGFFEGLSDKIHQ